MLELESILDTPKEGLDPVVWQQVENGRYVLTKEAETNIKILVDYVSRRFDINQPSVRITGSITSNQYSEESDIDVHISFDGLNEGNSDDLNKVLRADFDEKFKVDFAQHAFIGNHPLEVYFQVNPYQDLMSIGCYDFIQKMWLVGPDLKPLDFDPYSEYYSKDMEYVKDIIKDIRNTILECYETALVIQNSSDGKFRESEYEKLRGMLKTGVDIFNSARQSRKVFSSPSSVEDALEKKESKKWKIADSAFKLMDKFGYLKILKNFSKINEKIDSLDMETVADQVVYGVKHTVNLNETVDESVSGLGRIMLISTLLAIPGILPQEALAKGLSAVKTVLNIFNPDVQDAIEDASLDKQKYGGYSATDVINMIARTLYVEGHSQGTDGRKAILSVIKNRSGGNNDDIPAVIKEKYAFSCWNKMTDSDWKNFKYSVPSKGSLSIIGNPKNRDIWIECVRLAGQLFRGKFESTIGNRNSYLNPDTANDKAKNSWGKDMDLQVGDHKFGYLKEHDPKYVVPGTMKPKSNETPNKTHVVKSGDSLSKIAKANNTTVKDILSKNPGIKNPDKISIGQKISV